MTFASLLLAAALVTPAAPQPRWTDIGITAVGNHVSVDPRSVKRTGNLVSATVRVLFTPPVQTPKGPWASSQTKATFDCARQSVAAKENAYFADAGGRRLTERTVNRMPGYGPALKGSMVQVALTWLCRAH